MTRAPFTRPTFVAPSDEDIRAVSRQLGRPARGVIGIAARCVCGTPTVVATAPRLDDGTPFPTLYYLSHPAATAAISTLEATGVMVEFSELLAADPELRAQYQRAHESYIADRETVDTVPEIDGISAGGMPNRVKCLHSLAGHALAAGPGVNPVGDLALARCTWSPEVCECASDSVHHASSASLSAPTPDGSPRDEATQ
ncbi:MAG: DUF501 domain-containing protein [Terrimesophilobacter sp.]